MSAATARRRILGAGPSSTVIVYLVLLAVVVVGAILTATADRNFFSGGNVAAILTATSILGLVAIGQTLVILVGSLDLSVPYVVSLASIIGGTTMAGEASNILPAVLLTLAVSAAIGLVSGLVVSQLHVHGFIATLGVGLIVSGYLGTNYQGSSGSAPKAFRALDEAKVGPVPVSVLIMLGLAALVLLLLSRTRIGHHMYAVGGSPDVARLSGLRTSPPVILAHVLCSVMAGVAGLLLLSRLSVGSPTIGSQGGYDLLSIAAVVLGGTLLAGGRGGVVGTLGGVAIFAVMDNTMGALEVNPFLKDVVRGVIIIAAVAVYARRNLQVRPARFDRSVADAPAGSTPPAQEVR
ncbi:ABC transporter permease [Aeromicrobium alkaliterrae]|uniref:Ribose ABC transporter permease n=1 Tax=Aeromicrobium alkaliterrae TaxID=302168 RepID=A0ABP4VT90_9ACTN